MDSLKTLYMGRTANLPTFSERLRALCYKWTILWGFLFSFSHGQLNYLGQYFVLDDQKEYRTVPVTALEIGYLGRVHFRLWKRNTNSVVIVTGLGEPM